jgi:mannose-1-phosphate guanylyltransferase / phosphomannomutase
MKAVIVAGGRGVRMGPLVNEIPKPMIEIGGIPVIEHQIKNLIECGIKEIIITTNYLGEVIKSYIGNGERFGAEIKYLEEKKPLGTAGGIKGLPTDLKEDFIVIYGDILLSIDFQKFIEFHKKNKAFVSLIVHPSNHPYDSDLVLVDRNNKIKGFKNKPHLPETFYNNLGNAGIYILNPGVLDYISSDEKMDFTKDIFPKLIEDKKDLYAYNTPEYIQDMGTLERLESVRKDFESRKVERFNLKNKRIAIFLDRDGVINYDYGNIHKKENFKLLPGVIEAIKKINSSEYLAIVITNQPVIAKGLCNFEELEEIHKKMETLLGNENAKLDKIYFCPHHPERGFEGEVIELKIKCDCRKPEIGMILNAKSDFNIDLKKSFIIGDSERDILAGFKSGLNPILVKKNVEEFSDIKEVKERFKKCEDLSNAVKFIIEGK